MTPSTDPPAVITEGTIRSWSDEELNKLILQYNPRGAWGWMVDIAQDELQRRHPDRRLYRD